MSAARPDDRLLGASEIDPGSFPTLNNISAGHMFKAVVRPMTSAPPEYVVLPELSHPTTELGVAVAEWNLLWESAQFRRRYFDLDELPPAMAKIADLGDTNVIFLPRTRSRYHEYAPLLHLLPARTLEEFGLPALRGGQWPFLIGGGNHEGLLPNDFERRLRLAWASTVWPHVQSGSTLNAFAKDEPIRLLAHNLDFWVPAVTSMIQSRLREFPEVEQAPLPARVLLEDGSVLHDAVPAHPRAGGPIWWGEDDARAAVAETVEAADQTGKLRAIIEAVRSTRVADDFSSRWSFAREDFERKLYRKRAKIGVRFVELTDTIPVQGPESSVEGNLVTNDFMAMLDERSRQVVVLLNSGITNRAEIAELLGYAGHSSISKRLTQIRKAAETYFDRR